MLFDTTLRRDLARGYGATLVVVLTIVITMMLVRTLSLAASDVIEPKDVMLALGYTALAQLPTIMSLSLFVSVVLGLGRMYRDSEMAIWFASGLPLGRFVRPVMRTFWPVLVFIGLLVVFAWPWVNRSNAEIRERYAQRSDLSRVTPGVFQSSADGRTVFFVERDPSRADTARNIFVTTSKNDTESVVSAPTGRVEVIDGDRFLVLERGQRSDVDTKTQESTLARFQSYQLLVSPDVARRKDEVPPKNMSTAELLRLATPQRQGELVWRFGLIAGAMNMLLLAIGLAHVNPRRPTNWNLLFALLAAAVYYNLINLSQVWVGSSRVRFSTAFFGLHGAVFVGAIGLLWWRDHAVVLRRRRAAAA